jgi:hypothetical protein
VFYGGGVVGLILMAIWIYALFDVITTPNGATRHLPKVGWILIVIFLSTIGAAAWFFLGRPAGASFAFGGRGGDPKHVRPSDTAMSDAERERIERQRKMAEIDAELDRRIEEKKRRAAEEGGPEPVI